ncbi:MAG: response regulator transcription factor [Bacteroidota bacterium]|nr:response regulator transcription factor [Bacteroidota bacterium]
MAKGTVLVVEDEDDIRELLAFNLRKEGYTVEQARTGEEALQKAGRRTPDCIVLDLMLPGMDGLEVCRLLRSRPETVSTPILMVTARTEESDIVAGLELGADDYITKPFSPRVFLARVKSVMRRKASTPAGENETIRIHDLVIDPQRHQVHASGKKIDLTATEFRILYVLARRAGWVFTRAQIVEAIRGDDYPVTDRSVDVQIVGIRRKMGDAAAYIETVRGVGYRFRE